MTPREVTEQFLSAINAHDVEHLASLMTSDHRFVDSLGQIVEGQDAMREGWKLYFAMVPDYKLDIRRWFVAEDGATEVLLVGMASGSCRLEGVSRPDSSWSAPVALRAVIRKNKIAEWQVYADNEPIREQMRAASA